MRYSSTGSDSLRAAKKIGIALLVGGGFALLLAGYFVYTRFRIEVPGKHIAVLTHKVGKDLDNNQIVAPDATYKGIQLEVLTEGRHFRNPFNWNWKIYPMVEVPENKMGVRIRLYGTDLPYGHFLATKDTEKGIVEDVLRPARYPINAIVYEKVADPNNPHKFTWKTVNPRPIKDYVEIIELHDPMSVSGGFKGIVTNLAGTIPQKSTMLVEKGERGVQKETLDAATHYLNPYKFRVQSIDVRSQRFDLSTGEDMGFPSKDGFWVTLDGIIEFRIKPGFESEVFVTYNEDTNDTNIISTNIGEEIIAKVITPNARSFCRLQGSNSTGKEMIGGETRVAFQTNFQKAIEETCDEQGIEILQALITKINPPQAIADPVRKREVARQQQKMYTEQMLQQVEEAKLATEKALVTQRTALVTTQQQVVEMTTKAQQEQEVALEGANRDLEVAVEKLEAAKDTAAANLSKRKAAAAVVLYQNEADAAGWKRSIEALGGDGEAFARYVFYQKIAPSYRSIMVNTADTPLMDMFRGFAQQSGGTKIDTSKITPLVIDLPADVVIPKIPRKTAPAAPAPAPAPTALAPTPEAPAPAPAPTPEAPAPAAPAPTP